MPTHRLRTEQLEGRDLLTALVATIIPETGEIHFHLADLIDVTEPLEVMMSSDSGTFAFDQPNGMLKSFTAGNNSGEASFTSPDGSDSLGNSLDALTRTGVSYTGNADDIQISVKLNGVDLDVPVVDASPSTGNPFFDEFISFEEPEDSDFFDHNGDDVEDELVKLRNNGRIFYGAKYGEADVSLFESYIDIPPHRFGYISQTHFLATGIEVVNTSDSAIRYTIDVTVDLEGEIFGDSVTVTLQPGEHGFENPINTFPWVVDHGLDGKQRIVVTHGETVLMDQERTFRTAPTALGPIDASLGYEVIKVNDDSMVFDVIVNNPATIIGVDFSLSGKGVSEYCTRCGSDHNSVHFVVLEPGETRVRYDVPKDAFGESGIEFRLGSLADGSFALGIGGVGQDLNLSNNTVVVTIPVEQVIPACEVLFYDNDGPLPVGGGPQLIGDFNGDGLGDFYVGPIRGFIDGIFPEIGSIVLGTGEDGPINFDTVEMIELTNVPPADGLNDWRVLFHYIDHDNLVDISILWDNEVIDVLSETTNLDQVSSERLTDIHLFGNGNLPRNWPPHFDYNGDGIRDTRCPGNVQGIDLGDSPSFDPSQFESPIVTVGTDGTLRLGLRDQIEKLTFYTTDGSGAFVDEGAVDLRRNSIFYDKEVHYSINKASESGEYDLGISYDGDPSKLRVDVLTTELERIATGVRVQEPNVEHNPITGYVDIDGSIVLEGDGQEALVVNVTGATTYAEDPAPFEFVLETDTEVTFGNLEDPLTIDEVRLPVRYTGNDPEIDLKVEIGTPEEEVIAVDLSFTCGNGHLDADGNADGRVDFRDFLRLASNFGATDATFADGDFNCDGSVNFQDFLRLAANFGSTS